MASIHTFPTKPAKAERASKPKAQRPHMFGPLGMPQRPAVNAVARDKAQAVHFAAKQAL